MDAGRGCRAPPRGEQTAGRGEEQHSRNHTFWDISVVGSVFTRRCRTRFLNKVNPDIKRVGSGAWLNYTLQEQERAEQLFREHGPNYADIAERMITRTPNQMRVYFQRRGRHLVDGEEPRRSTPWTPSEKRLIILGQQRLGNKWTAIARELPGRTAGQVQNHWSTRLKKPPVALHLTGCSPGELLQ